MALPATRRRAQRQPGAEGNHRGRRHGQIAKAAGKRDDGDIAMAWCHPFGAGRVFYTALGHGMPTWTDARFHQHQLGGIRWAMGDTE